ncbi:hypothetical protein PT974_05915 [Cladobotryum mycophilum]|uniref:Uncharacterized protein n=1 Tax=Cladobotryum mycophilum TaxID=491253 RepID=A0ABR0SK35_9HYPO
MWLSTPSVESLTRPRIAVAVVSAVAAASIGYYAYAARASALQPTITSLPGGGLHRSNAIRRTRRSRGNGTASSSSSEAPGDENAENHEAHTIQPTGDGETVVEANADDWFNDHSVFPASQRAGHNIVNLLFRVSEDNARRNGCVHRGCQCNACGMVPIRGVRYRCANCADFDLCETCEAQGVHIKTHIFYKIRVPAPPFGPRQMQPVWYTGDPDTCRRNLPRGLIAKLSRETGFERPELEAFWEQWTFMANTEWREDPDELCVAMDRKTFERCLVPTGGSRHASPNLIHDRMFSFYDSNKDDLIGFSEFLHGLSYRKRKDKLRKVFDGYDIDGDKYVNRRDFLRMFRAYYVLYKQMHKDILDGLEDQLLASTEAQQLVASRQPLSSLFGREGRVPSADNNLRFDGKTYRADGTVEVAPGFEHAVVTDQQDTAKREDILTSLFAYGTDHRSRRRFAAGADSDSNWRTVHSMNGNDTDRTYWVTLLEPPTTLEELPAVLVNNNNNNETDTEDDGEDEERDREADEDQDGIFGERRDSDFDPFAAGRIPTESEIREGYILHMRNQGPKLEKRRRDMARKQLHERWKRRQFYLDEEEGGRAPDDWEDEEDILTHDPTAESSKMAQRPSSTRSRSSSKVRFAEDTDDFETRSNASTSSRSLPERWGGMDIPTAERDAGKEILYQVTQQAFNELLDTIFKPAEDLATEAAETKDQRERYKDTIDALDSTEEDANDKASQTNGVTNPSHQAIEDKALEELLAVTGYTIEQQEEPRNAVEIDITIEILADEQTEESSLEIVEHSETEYRDPTLPQFRPNSEVPAIGLFTPSSSRHASMTSGEGVKQDGDQGSTATTMSEPTLEMLRRWKQLNTAEAEAAKRGGWGRLSFEEFEEIYKKQEHQGNRLDYLGSWIDFCIP